MRIKKDYPSLIDKIYENFCIVPAEPIDEKWAICYSCMKALRIVSHIPINGLTDTHNPRQDTLGVCVKPDLHHQLVSLIDFDQQKHIVLCTQCLGNTFLSTRGNSLWRRCEKCLVFFNDTDPDYDISYFNQGYVGTEFDVHYSNCRSFVGKTRSSFFKKCTSERSNGHATIKPFLLRKDQIK